MKSFLSILLILFAAVGCRAHKEEHSSSLMRHTDSVATLRSLAARELTREVETTVVTLRPDTTGMMVEVARDVVRTVSRETECSKTADTSSFHAAKHTNQENKTQETRPDESKGHANAFVAGATVAAVLLAAGLLAIHYAKWNSRT